MGDSSVSFDRYDALVVGAGFSGIAMLYRLRKLGLNAKIFEAGDQFGGTWHWNRYPGARVDSEFPWYQLNIPELYTTWTFKERYPDHRRPRPYHFMLLMFENAAICIQVGLGADDELMLSR